MFLNKKKLTPYLFFLPFLLIYLLFWIWPIFFSFYLSLVKWSGGSSVLKFVGIRNFVYLLRDEDFIAAFWNTLYYSGAIILIMLPLAMVLALLLNSSFTFFKGLFRSVIFSPIVMSTVVVSMIFMLILDDRSGLLTYLFSLYGLKFPSLLATKTWVLPTIIGIGLWRSTGVYMLFFLAGLQSVPPELYEAAQIDGANKTQSFFYITLPQLRNTTVFTVTIALINSIKVFEEPYLLTGGGPKNASLTLALDMYRQSFTHFRYGYGAAISFILFLIIIISTLIFLKFSGAFRRENQ